RQNILVIRDRLVRHRRDYFCCALLDSTHLRYGHPRVTRDNITEWNRIVAVLQALFRRFQKLPVKVVVELFLGRESIPRNGMQLRETLVEVADSRLQALSRIVAPPAVLPGKPNESRGFGIFLRSEERRVGKECRSRWLPYEYKKNV